MKYKTKTLVGDPCYHWCVTGKHDWSHRLPYGQLSAAPDRYRKDCPEHAKIKKQGCVRDEAVHIRSIS